MRKAENLTNLQAGGLCLGWDKKLRRIYYNPSDTHSLIIGATRCGKTRRIVLPSIGLMAFAGESMIVTDPKGELHDYTAPFLRRLGYEIIVLNFKDPTRGNHYNFLQPVLDAAMEEDLPLAVSRARDIAQMLVPEEANKHNDPIWTDGQRAVITLGILAAALQMDNAAHQNMANAWKFVAEMCAPVGPKGEIALTSYLAELPDSSPLIRAMAIARIAPEKMRGSFYSSALAAMELYADPGMHELSKVTDFDHMATGTRKRAIFLIVPDDRSTYYPLVSLFVYEQYQMLVRQADERGGRLGRRVNFVCDEFGNFVRIPDFDKFITVGGGRGIRFHLFLQDTNQIYNKYGDQLGKTMISNCETWVYMKSDNMDTMREMSQKLGKYTVKSPSLSGSTGGNSSASYSLTGRELLTEAEVSLIEKPWQLVTSRAYPGVFFTPDISKTIFCRLYGMGDEEHDRQLRIYRQRQEPLHSVSVSYWDGWKPYVAAAKAGLG